MHDAQRLQQPASTAWPTACRRATVLTAGLRCNLAHMLPFGDRTRDDSKERVRRGTANFDVTAMDSRAALAQLAQQPPPFVLQLPISGQNALSGPSAAEFGLIKRIAARTSFEVDLFKVAIDGSAR